MKTNVLNAEFMKDVDSAMSAERMASLDAAKRVPGVSRRSLRLPTGLIGGKVGAKRDFSGSIHTQLMDSVREAEFADMRAVRSLESPSIVSSPLTYASTYADLGSGAKGSTAPPDELARDEGADVLSEPEVGKPVVSPDDGESDGTQLSIPSRSDWGTYRGTSCSWNDVSATCAIPNVRAKTTSDFHSLDAESYASNVKIHGATDEEEDLIQHAWALLRSNQDLITFAVCWVMGAGNADDLTNLLNLADPNGRLTNRVVSIRVGPWWCFTSPGGSFWGCSLTRTIYICRHNVWDRYLFVWDSDRSSDRYCAAVDLACTLLHELTHVAGLVGYDYSGNCDDSYLIENTFRWAMFQRHSEAGEGCCDRISGDDVFYEDNSIYLNTTCCESDSYCYRASSSSSDSPRSSSDDDHTSKPHSVDHLEHRGEPH